MPSTTRCAACPTDRIRYHTCYSINIGPRVHDMELKHIVDIMLRINAGAYSFEAANPRHEHEWQVWESVKLPEGKALIPGVITHSSNIVEHPELIAERIARFASAVGRENVIAGADCGFASFAATCEVHPSVVWVKLLQALAEGARIASRELWGAPRDSPPPPSRHGRRVAGATRNPPRARRVCGLRCANPPYALAPANRGHIDAKIAAFVG